MSLLVEGTLDGAVFDGIVVEGVLVDGEEVDGEVLDGDVPEGIVLDDEPPCAGVAVESVVEGVGDVSAGIGVVGCCWTWSVVGVELFAGSVVVCAET
jgi:hypothetical protein